MKKRQSRIAEAALGRPYEDLTNRERKVIDALAEGGPVAANTNREFDSRLTFGERLADQVARFGGSWPFILIFSGILVVWVIVNSLVLTRIDAAFDPYPYILLNLVLSTLAAFQAPIVMMAQNRQAAKDRLEAGNAFEVALKTELAIADLHRKLDQLIAGNEDDVG